MPAESSNKKPDRSSPGPPPEDAFPAYPASWYLFCASRRLRRGPFSQRILGRRMVAFRTASGKVAVMDGNCAHLGADLGQGRVVDETIQCPFHGWRYGADGACAAMPNGESPPSAACLRTYPVAERHGHVFFFHGASPLFPLPFLLSENPDDYVAGKVFRYEADCAWYMNSAHAFDRQHFATVHDRELTAPPTIDCPAPYARRNSYPAKIVGRTLFDRVLRVAVGRSVEVTLTIWGGTFAVITADYERLRSGFTIAMRPLENGHTLCEGIVYAPRARGPLRLLDRPRLAIRTLFTHGYLQDEARRLRETRYRPESLGAVDQEMIDFFRWVASLASLPRAAAGPRRTETGEGDHEEDVERGSAPAVVGDDGDLHSAARMAPIGPAVAGAGGP